MKKLYFDGDDLPSKEVNNWAPNYHCVFIHFIDKDPVIDGFITDRTPMSEVSQKVVFNPCLTVPHHNLTSVKRKQAKGAIEIEDQQVFSFNSNLGFFRKVINQKIYIFLQNLRNRKVGGDTNKKKKRDPYKIPKGTTRKSSNTTIGSSTHSLGPGSKSSSIDHFSSNIDISEQLCMTQTRQIEKMVDDITNKLQEKADDIITIHVSDVYLHSK